MNRRFILSTVSRWILVFAVVLAMILAWPDAWLVLLTPLTGFMSNLICPYLDSITLAIEEGVIHVRGGIQIGMVLADGSPLPAVPGEWQKHGQQTLNILLVALPVWAMPPMTWRRRLLGLPLVLVGSLVVCGYDLTVQIQESALSMIG